MALAPALNYLMLVCLWTVPKNRIKNTFWEIVQETSRFAKIVFRHRITQAVGTKVEIAPGNRLLFKELLETMDTPYGRILGILNNEMAAMLHLMQCYLSTKTYHWQVPLSIVIALLLSLSSTPHTPR